MDWLQPPESNYHADQRETKLGGKIVTFSSVEDANASISAVKYFIPLEGGVWVCFDPHASHGVVKDLILLEQTQATVVHEYAAILPSPYLVTTNYGIAASPGTQQESFLGNWTLR
jgi:hypothetical protein